MSLSRTQRPTPPILAFSSERTWAKWLSDHHTDSKGVWVKIAKLSSRRASVSYAAALEVALCFGWIDGQKRAYDETSWLQKFTRRGTRSVWSKVNREKAKALLRAGRMKPAGRAAMNAAQASGRWATAYDSPAKARVPIDLRRALTGNASARRFFATLNGQNRYAILHRLQTAKKPETRARRLAQFVEMLARHETLHPQWPPSRRGVERRRR
jgi:uncharacterized protein YdeI (YjbR/CyaY-like superfamily)